MDLELWVSVAGATVAAAATIVGGAFGLYRWSQERNRERSDEFEANRRQAYRGLWDAVERLHADIRRGTAEAEFGERLAAINEYLFRNEIYLDASCRPLVNDYVRALRALKAEAVATGSEVDLPVAETGEVSPVALEKAAALADVVRRAETLREQLRQTVRSALGEID